MILLQQEAWEGWLLLSLAWKMQQTLCLLWTAGILYTSKETHYSVMKAARMYRMDAIEVSCHPPKSGPTRRNMHVILPVAKRVP